MFDFKNLSEYKVCEMLKDGINPLTGERYNQGDFEKIYKIIKVIHSAVRNYEIDFNPVYVFIPGVDARVKIVEQISIKPFSENISDAIEVSIKQKTSELSAKNIQIAILRYLSNESLIQYSGNTYYATQKGESCGIINAKITGTNNKKQHKVIYSAYMQTYIIRMLPDILYFELFYQYKDKCSFDNLINITEPLSIEEQQLITKFRFLNESNKKLVKATIMTLSNANSTDNRKNILFK